LDLDGRSLVPVFSAGGEKPSGWRDEVFVEDLGRGCHPLRTPKWAYIEWDDGEQELYDMSIDPYQLQSLHADPGKAELISGLSARLKTFESCSGAPAERWKTPRESSDTCGACSHFFDAHSTQPGDRGKRTLLASELHAMHLRRTPYRRSSENTPSDTV